MKQFLIIISCFIIGLGLPIALAQEADLPTFDSVDGGLFFDQVMIYQYSDHSGESGEVWIYLNSCNHRMLFDQAAWGREDEMIDYIIAQQDGSYLTLGKEADGAGTGKIAMVDSAYLEAIEVKHQFPLSDDYVVFTKQENADKEAFGLEINSYSIEKSKDTRGKESISLARVKFDTRLIYHFNRLNIDLQIPFLGNPHPYLPSNDLITEYESAYIGADGTRYWNKLKLVAIEYTNYWAPVSEYTFRFKDTADRLVEKPLGDVITLYDSCNELR